MDLTSLTAISPLDGRYRNKAAPLAGIVSEFGLIRYRVLVEAKATATAWDRDMTSSLAKMRSTWNRTVRSRTPRSWPISQFVLPRVIHMRTVNSRGDRF